MLGSHVDGVALSAAAYTALVDEDLCDVDCRAHIITLQGSKVVSGDAKLQLRLGMNQHRAPEAEGLCC